MGSRDLETGEKLGRCYECGGNGCAVCNEYPDDQDRWTLSEDGVAAAIAKVNEVQGRCGTHLVQVELDGSRPLVGDGVVDVNLLVRDVVSAYLDGVVSA